MPTQTESGKAFEYAIVQSIYNDISIHHKASLVTDNAYLNAKKCYELHDTNEKEQYNKAANSAITHLVTLEPRLLHPLDKNDHLVVKIQEDRLGIQGDVRDILTIRTKQEWEIGISAKNNHEAVRHSRLSDNINFGQQWLGVSCSNEYFATITPIFKQLRQLKKDQIDWSQVENKDTNIYIPILNAFTTELTEINKNNPQIPKKLLKYLIGNKDFYKIIKRNTAIILQAFNLNGTLNQNAGTIRPQNRITKTPLPNSIMAIRYKDNSSNTIQIFLDEGWSLDFRIHNASTKVEPSLKFDITLKGLPSKLYTNHLQY